MFSSYSVLITMSLRFIISSWRQFMVEIMFCSTLASASLLSAASFLVRLLYLWVITSVISEQVDRCNKKFKPPDQTVKWRNYTIQFTITTTGDNITLEHITAISFYISIHFIFPDVITGYKHFFRCVNC